MPKTLSSQQAKPALSPWSKGGIGLGLGALALVVIGLVFPTGGAFFPLVSLWCSCVLFYGALWVLRVGLRQLHRQAVQRRDRLCPRPGGGVRVHLRFLCR